MNDKSAHTLELPKILDQLARYAAFSASHDLALALAAPALRIEAPVPGKPMVGIEVPNGTTSVVEVIPDSSRAPGGEAETTAWRSTRASSART